MPVPIWHHGIYGDKLTPCHWYISTPPRWRIIPPPLTALAQVRARHAERMRSLVGAVPLHDTG